VSSYGQLTIDSIVTDWVTIDYSESYCANGESGFAPYRQNGTISNMFTCLRNALSKVDAQVNFTLFDLNSDQWIDGIGFLHSGYDAAVAAYDVYNSHYTGRIWSHKYEMTPEWTSAEGVRVSNYHISSSLRGVYGSSITTIGTVTHETGHL
jgi:M6 family metalloprotease-like protein